MGRVRRKIIFCTECGKEYSIRQKKCTKCKKNLNQKNHLLKDFIFDHIKDELQGKVVDNIFSLIKNFIVSNLYGTVLVATIIFTSISVIVNTITNNNVKYKEIANKPVSAPVCNLENLIEQIMTCEDGYTLTDDECVKSEEKSAKSTNVCPRGYYLKGNNCLSNTTYTKTTEEKCLKPDTLPTFLTTWDNYVGVSEYDGKCILSYCVENSWDEFGVCQAGSGDEIPYTTVTSCATGELMDGECRTVQTPTKEYTCSEGKLDGKKCIITEKIEPNITCPDGYIYNDDCQACEKE